MTLYQFIEDEINFHKEHQCPWYWKILCKIFNQREPQDILVYELELIKRMCRKR